MPQLVRKADERRRQPRVGPAHPHDADALELARIALDQRVDKRGGADCDGLDVGAVDLGARETARDGARDARGDIGGGGGLEGREDGGGSAWREVEDDRIAD